MQRGNTGFQHTATFGLIGSLKFLKSFTVDVNLKEKF